MSHRGVLSCGQGNIVNPTGTLMCSDSLWSYQQATVDTVHLVLPQAAQSSNQAKVIEV